MPQWVRHTSQIVSNPGFWTATQEPVIVDNCSTVQQNALQSAFTSLSANAGLNSIPELKAKMLPLWGGMRIDCCFDETRPPRGDTPEGRIFICGETGTALEAAVCKGLAEEATSPGSLLDSKAMQFACFGSPIGAPTPTDFAIFAARPVFGGNPAEREGEYVIWNRTSGQIFSKVPGAGGFWTASGATMGTQVFISPAWVG